MNFNLQKKKKTQEKIQPKKITSRTISEETKPGNEHISSQEDDSMSQEPGSGEKTESSEIEETKSTEENDRNVKKHSPTITKKKKNIKIEHQTTKRTNILLGSLLDLEVRALNRMAELNEKISLMEKKIDTILENQNTIITDMRSKDAKLMEIDKKLSKICLSQNNPKKEIFMIKEEIPLAKNFSSKNGNDKNAISEKNDKKGNNEKFLITNKNEITKLLKAEYREIPKNFTQKTQNNHKETENSQGNWQKSRRNKPTLAQEAEKLNKEQLHAIKMGQAIRSPSKVRLLYFSGIRKGKFHNIKLLLVQLGIKPSEIINMSFVGKQVMELVCREKDVERIISALDKFEIKIIPGYNPCLTNSFGTGVDYKQEENSEENIKMSTEKFQERLKKASENQLRDTTRIPTKILGVIGKCDHVSIHKFLLTTYNNQINENLPNQLNNETN